MKSREQEGKDGLELLAEALGVSSTEESIERITELLSLYKKVSRVATDNPRIALLAASLHLILTAYENWDAKAEEGEEKGEGPKDPLELCESLLRFVNPVAKDYIESLSKQE